MCPRGADSDHSLHESLRRNVRELCGRFPDAYWRDLETRREYPEEFVSAMFAPFLAVALARHSPASGCAGARVLQQPFREPHALRHGTGADSVRQRTCHARHLVARRRPRQRRQYFYLADDRCGMVEAAGSVVSHLQLGITLRVAMR